MLTPRSPAGTLPSLALVGCGRVAAKHLKAIAFQESRGRVRFLALVDSKPERAKALLTRVYPAKRADELRIFSSTAELFQNLKPDIVAITTPSGTHHALALEALAQGAHLLLEKPMAMSLAEAEEIARAAEQAERTIALGHIYRYMPCMALLQQDIAAGRFGRVHYGSVVVRWGHDQAYYDQAAWRGTRAGDGGVIMNQSVHALDLMRWLLNVQDEEILHCQGLADTQSHRMEAEDLGLGLFSFANGSYLIYEGTTSSQPEQPEASFFINCEKADIRAAVYAKKIRFSLREGGKERRWSYLRRYFQKLRAQEGCAGLLQVFNPHTAIYSDLLAAIREGRETLASPRAGLSSLEMVEALYRACGIL